MATAPKDRVGNASGVLSTTRQVGSLMGIAILGAVLQNQVTANITQGVQAISQIPDAVKQKIIAAAASGSMQMGAPSAGSGLPATAQAMIGSLFKGWFTDAIASAFIVAVILAVIGAVCALLLSSHVKEAQEDEAAVPASGGPADAALAETAVAEADSSERTASGRRAPPAVAPSARRLL